jgi:hypothetical protein
MKSTQQIILSPRFNLVIVHTFSSYTPPKNMTCRKSRDISSNPSTMKNEKPIQDLVVQ